MKIAVRCLGALLVLVALAAAGLGIWAAFHFEGQLPILVKSDPAARAAVDDMLEAVRSGDYALASTMILGTPDLGVDKEAQEELGRLVWEAYQSSIKFTPLGECYATQSGVAFDYEVECLRYSSIMDPLKERSGKLLQERVAAAEDISEVYDSNNEYREDFVLETLRLAVEAALVEDAQYTRTQFTVNLVYQEGKWWVVADNALLSAISGGLAG